ncbi:AAA family ATPase [bacterium]|nr:AAA family ATPase [bacterium]
MKIQSISGYKYTNSISKNNDNAQKTEILKSTNNVVSFPNVYYGRELVNSSIPSFKGTDELAKSAIEMALKIPVSDRLAQVLQNIKLGDVILLGSDFNRAQTAFRKYVNKISSPIKREFYLPDRELTHDYVFFKHTDGDNHIMNINNEEFFIRVNGAHYSLDPGKSSSVQDGNLIQFLDSASGIGEHFYVKDKPQTNLSNQTKFFTRVYDYSKDIDKSINRLNFETVSKQIQQERGVPSKIDFSRIGGQTKAIEELKKGILYPVKYPSAYNADDITRGFILYGPPGTGKTEISRALANEAGVNYMYMSGTEFESKYVGESEENVRAFFQSLKENQPSIGVIDEIDAIGKERGEKDVYGAKVVNQILTSLTDLYNSGDDVFILGLTNKYETLDSALKRSERFSKHIKIDAPDKDGIKEILKIHTSGKALDKDVDMDVLSDKLFDVKAVGGDIKFISKMARENMMNRLGIYEKMENGTFVPSDMDNAVINQEDFLNAINRFKEQGKKTTKPIGFNK